MFDTSMLNSFFYESDFEDVDDSILDPNFSPSEIDMDISAANEIKRNINDEPSCSELNSRKLKNVKRNRKIPLKLVKYWN